MTLWKNYYVPANLSDALQAYASASGAALWIAGGTDLLLDLQQGRHAPVETLIDVTAIPELTALEVRQDALYVGAALPLNRIVSSPIVHEHAQALVEACSLIGGPQVRNTATLGGNVAHALPAGDGTIALLALEATAEVASLNGRKLLPQGDLYLGPGRSALVEQNALVLGFHLPLKAPGQASAFRRVMRPQGVAIAILNMAVWLERQDYRITDVRIAIGAAGPTPFRARAAEAALRGNILAGNQLSIISYRQTAGQSFPAMSAILAQSLEALLAEAHFRTSPHRATTEYRRHVAGVLFTETLKLAWDRALTV